MDTSTPLAKAIDTIGLTALAKAVGVRPPSICKWRSKGYVPAGRVPAVSRVTGLAYHDLNPEFPQDATPPPPAREDAPTVALPPNPDRIPAERAGLTPQQAEEVA